MKLSILPVSLFSDIMSGRMSVAQWATMAQDCGTDGYDISAMFWRMHTPNYIDSLHRKLDDAGIIIQPNMVCCYPDFTHPDDIEKERQLDYLRRDIALASAFGFKYVRITAGMDRPGIDRKAAAARVSDYFKRAAESAQRYGVELVFENHAKPGAWSFHDISFDPEIFLSICNDIRGTGVGVNFDTANATVCNADPVELLREVSDLVRTVHMSDTSTSGAVTHAVIGEGLVDFDKIFAALNSIGFDGTVSIEEASGTGYDGILKSIRTARQYVRKGANS